MRKYALTRKGKFVANSVLAIVLLVEYICMDYNLMQMFGTVCVYMGVTILSEIFIQGQMRNAASLATASIVVFPIALGLSICVEFFVRCAFFFVVLVIGYIDILFSISLDFAFLNDFMDYCCQFLDNFSRLYCIVYCVSLPMLAASFDKMEMSK